LERDQGCREGGQTTPSQNTPAVLEGEQLYVDEHSHGGALYRMSAFHNSKLRFYILNNALIHTLHLGLSFSLEIPKNITLVVSNLLYQSSSQTSRVFSTLLLSNTENFEMIRPNLHTKVYIFQHKSYAHGLVVYEKI
jgi:hypothetical protein